SSFVESGKWRREVAARGWRTMSQTMPKETTDNGGEVHELRECLGRLATVVEQQQLQIEEQRDAYDKHLAQLQAEIATLSTVALSAASRAEQAAESTEGGTTGGIATAHTAHRASSLESNQGSGQGSTRRALLKWGGATAAAATVALVASEQRSAHAAAANN